MVIPSLSEADVKKHFPKGFKVHDVPSGKTYIRTTPMPSTQ
jgi:1-Cys peroxiredoxin 6